MVEKTDVQVNAARTAAKARQAIAERIGKLAPSVEKTRTRRSSSI